MKFDDLLKVVGEFGPYQKRVYFLATLPVLLSGFETLSVVFIFNIPPHRCAIPGLRHDTFHVKNDTHERLINAYIPYNDVKKRWSQCHLNNGVQFEDVVNNVSDPVTGPQNITECDRWVYDHSIFESTIPTDFDVVCDRTVHRASSNMFAEMGSIGGTLVGGFLADRFGRKIPFYLGALALIGGGFGIAFTTNLITLNLCRFIIGVARMALWTNGLVIGLEIVGPSKRVFAGTFIEFMWCLGMFLLIIFGYFIRQWRYLEIALSVPSLFLLTYWWLIPESPRWYVSQGRYKDALKILEKIAISNKTNPPKEEDIKNAKDVEQSFSFRDALKSKELITRLVIVFSNMFFLVVIYYALIYNITNLAGDIFINYIIATIMETLGLTAPFLLLDRLGRKRVYCASMLLGGAVCTAGIIPALFNAPDIVFVILAICGRFFACAAFSILYIYGAELFPTIIRGSTMGMGVTFSRLGGIIAPYMADVGILVGGKLEKGLPFILMGSPALLVSFLAFYLPETKGVKLPETMEDLNKNRSRTCLCRTRDDEPEPDVQEKIVGVDEEMKELAATPC